MNQRVQDFIDTAMAQANATQGTDLMWTQVRERGRGQSRAWGCGVAVGCLWHVLLLLQARIMERRRTSSRWG